MTKHHYKNDTDTEIVLVGVGVLAAGEILKTDETIDNPNLVDVKTNKEQPVNKESGDDK